MHKKITCTYADDNGDATGMIDRDIRGNTGSPHDFRVAPNVAHRILIYGWLSKLWSLFGSLI